MIDILIPTYNRAPFLIKNIMHLDNLISTENLEGYFRLLVSDNCSTDSTLEDLNRVKPRLKLNTVIYQQNENIGLEKNAIFLLEQAVSEFIMFIGDDDYLPSGYLSFVINTIKKDDKVTAIIPGFSALYADGTIRPARFETFDIKQYPAGFATALEISHFGHQLSGIVLKSVNLARTYAQNEANRNIYPFIYFLGFNNLRGNSYYVPKFKVLVSVENSKDWKYDDSGLLTEIFKNYAMLYPNNPIKRFLLNFAIMKKQDWRLRISYRNPINTVRALLHLWTSKEVDALVKLSLVALFPYLYVKRLFRFIKSRIA